MGFKKLIIRSYDGRFDRARIEDLQRRCEVRPSERAFLFTDTLGDPICRVRNSPIYTMLVAQLDNELVGVIQGSIKVVTIHKPHKVLAKVGYILGLRVAPLFRRKGIGSNLIRHLEEWFINSNVGYSYMATDNDNEPSVKLFTKLGYVKFRTPTILVNPIRHYPYHIASKIEIIKLTVEEAEYLYRNYLSSTEFFPLDIDCILGHKLSLGTWVAYYRGDSWDGKFATNGQVLPENWAVISVWNSGEIFKLRLGKAPLSCLIYTLSSKLMYKIFPCLNLPSIPDFYHPFGFYFMYGMHREGPFSKTLVRTLCQYVHNMARKSTSRDCKVIVTEIGGQDEMRDDIPHWELLSCPEDLWCIKGLKNEEKGTLDELIQTPPRALFVDPREV